MDNSTFNSDAISLACEYLEKKFGCKLSTTFYTNVRTWRNWWRGYDDTFHSYRQLGVDNAPRKREMYRMNMAKRITEDWAGLLLNERTGITVEDTGSNEWLQGEDGNGGVLWDNAFFQEGNELLEKAFALGTGAFIARADGAKVDKSGKVVADPECKAVIDYVDALCIIPLSISRSRITEVAFVSESVKRGKTCIYLETHTIGENGNYQIENEYFIKDGSRMKPTELPPGIVPLIDTGSPLPWFAIFTPNITNNNEYENGLGLSVYANAIDNLKGVDLAFNNFTKDLFLGGKKVFINKSMLQTDKDGKVITPDDAAQQLFQMVGDGMDFDAKQMTQEFNPSLRVAENAEAVQRQLDYLSFACGMGTHRYQFNFSGVKTATEYTGERQDLVQHAQRHSIVLVNAIKTLCAALLYIGRDFCGAAVDPETNITVDFADGFIIDDNAARENDRQDIRDGIKQKWEYRVKWYHETEEEAKAAIDSMQTAGQNPFGFMN